VTTSFQKEIVKELEPLGLEPIGLSSKGAVVLEHPLGFRMDVTPSPGDHRAKANLIAEAKKKIDRMKTVNEQFMLWLYNRHKLLPGEKKVVSFKLAEEVRVFLAQNSSIYHGASTNAIVEYARKVLRNTEPERKGPGEREWEITRPDESRPVLQYNPDDLDPPASIVADPLPEPAPVVEAHQNGNGYPGFSEDLMEQIKLAVAGPLMAELKDKTDRIELFQTELVTAHELITTQIEMLKKVADSIQDLLDVL